MSLKIRELSNNKDNMVDDIVRKIREIVSGHQAINIFKTYECKCHTLNNTLKTVTAIEELIRHKVRSAPVIRKLTKEAIGVLDVRDVVKFLVYHLSRQKDEISQKKQDLKNHQKSANNAKKSMKKGGPRENCITSCIKYVMCMKEREADQKITLEEIEAQDYDLKEATSNENNQDELVERHWFESRQLKPIEEEETSGEQQCCGWMYSNQISNSISLKYSSNQIHPDSLKEGPFMQRNIEYLKEIEKKQGSMMKIEYLARMRKFTVVKEGHSLLEIVKAFANTERIAGFKKNDDYMTVSTMKLCNYLLETFDIKDMMKIVKINQFIKKHIVRELVQEDASKPALEIFKKMDSENLSTIALMDANGEIINLFSNNDVKYWLESEKSIRLDNDALTFLSKIRPNEMQYDEGKFLKIDCSFSLYDAISTLRFYKLHRIIIQDKIGKQFLFSLTDFWKFILHDV